MKKLFLFLFAIFISIILVTPVNAGRGDKGSQRGNQSYERQHGPMHYGQGYRFNHYDHRNYHPRNYRGHWRSWHEWDDHYRNHRNWYRDGRYYRENGFLYFEFENDGQRFCFSIGR
jgi:hypothetical protein